MPLFLSRSATLRRRPALLLAVALTCVGAATAAAAPPERPSTSTKFYATAPAQLVVPLVVGARVTVALRNCGACDGPTSTQPFGSVEVRFPNDVGLDATGAVAGTDTAAWVVDPPRVDGTDTVLRLRNGGSGTSLAVAPGAELRLSIPVAVGAVASRFALHTQVKQSNDFSGTGNEFVLVGADPVVYLGAGPPAGLEFVTGPGSVQVSPATAVPLGTTPVLTMCPAPVVRVVDAQGQTVTWLPPTAVALSTGPVDAGLRVDGSSTAAALTQGGMVSFGRAAGADGSCGPGPGAVSATRIGLGYRLSAAATSGGRTFRTTAAAGFAVLPTYARCPGTCSTEAAVDAGTSALVSATLPVVPAVAEVAVPVLTFAVGLGTWRDQLAACNPDVGVDPTALNPDRRVVTVDLAGHDKRISLRWSKRAVQWATNNGSSQWRVCMEATYAFPTPSGPAPAGGDGLYVGALLACAQVAPGQPCVERLYRQSGEQLATVLLPDRPGDPRMI